MVEVNHANHAETKYQILAVGHTGITVSDLGNSCQFYREILGLPVSGPLRISGDSVERITGINDAEIDIAFVKCPGHVLELLCFVNPERKEASKLRACDPGFFHLCLKVKALDRVLQAIRGGGFEAISQIETLRDGPAQGMRVVYARDPDGVMLELVEEPPGLCFENLFIGIV